MQIIGSSLFKKKMCDIFEWPIQCLFIVLSHVFSGYPEDVEHLDVIHIVLSRGDKLFENSSLIIRPINRLDKLFCNNKYGA